MGQSQWQTLEKAAMEAQVSVSDPSNKYFKTDIVRKIIQDPAVDAPFQERPEALRNEMNKWFGLLDWWQALKRVNYPMRFVTLEGGPTTTSMSKENIPISDSSSLHKASKKPRFACS